MQEVPNGNARTGRINEKERVEILDKFYTQRGLKTIWVSNEKYDAAKKEDPNTTESPKLMTQPLEWQDKAILDNPQSKYTDGFGVKVDEDLLVLDFDDIEAHDDFVKRFPDIDTYIVKSPKGWHYYFKGWDKPFGSKNGYGEFGKLDLFSKGSSRYVVGPTSVRANGEKYVIENPAEIADVFPELEEFVNEALETKPKKENTKSETSENTSEGVGEGGRHTMLRDMAQTLRLKGRPSKEAVFAFLCEQNLIHCTPSQEESEIQSIIDADWRNHSRTVTRHKRNYVTTDEDISTLLEEGIEATGWRVRDNIRARKRQWSHNNGDWQDATDGLENTVITDIIKYCEPRPEVYIDSNDIPKVRVKNTNIGQTLKITDIDWKRGISVVSRRSEVDPVVLWLEDLPEAKNTNLLDNFLTKIFVMSKENRQDYREYYDWMFKAMLVAAITRAKEPGCEYQWVLTLQGPQGLGKTSLFKALVPNSLWYEGDFSFRSSTSKHRIEACMGKWMVEWQELGGLGTSDSTLNDVKSYISQEKDTGTRLAYQKHPEILPRNFILVATTNDASVLLNDESGQRRFCVANISNKRIDKEVYQYITPEIREQLWSEAMLLYKQGYSFAFDNNSPHSAVHVESIKANHSGNDLIQGKLDAWMGSLSDQDKKCVWKVDVICKMINYPAYGEPHVGHMKEVGNELRNRFGFEKKQIRVGSSNANYWFIPDNGEVPKVNGKTMAGGGVIKAEARDV